MQTFLVSLATFWLQTVVMMLIFGTILTILKFFSPCNPDQPKPPPAQLITDAFYWFLVPLFTNYVRFALLVTVAVWILGLSSPADLKFFMQNGHALTGLQNLSLGVQIILILLIQDIYMYWVHRCFHSAKLWKVHAVHHSTKQLEWFSTARFHPINIWLQFTIADALVLALGFSPMALAVMVPFNAFYSAFVHANLNWTFGPFRYLLASPVFHRWHHTMLIEGRDKNFAPTFPFLDVLFGTFYMPKGKLPEKYGVEDKALIDNFWVQLIYPFRRSKKSR